MLTNAYAWLKLIHVYAVLVFAGNVTFRVLWVTLAGRSRDARVIAHAMDGIIVTDRWITKPGVFLMIASGVATALYGELSLVHTKWIVAAVLLFILAGAIAGAGMAPLERRVRSSLQEPQPDLDGIAGLLRRWRRFGSGAIALLWLAMALMVVKWPN